MRTRLAQTTCHCHLPVPGPKPPLRRRRAIGVGAVPRLRQGLLSNSAYLDTHIPAYGQRLWASALSLLAVQSLLAKTGLTAADFKVIESNEAFASQALAVSKELQFNPARVNTNGGAIALGHPVGATGAIITVKAMYELERTGGKRALIRM